MKAIPEEIELPSSEEVNQRSVPPQITEVFTNRLAELVLHKEIGSIQACGFELALLSVQV